MKWVLSVSRRGALAAVGFGAAIGMAAPANAIMVIDFEEFANGQSISNGFNIDLGAPFVGSISAAGNNLGAAIFDSTVGGPNAGGADPDLLVGLGNVLILQNDNLPRMTGNLFDTPDDDPNGGSIMIDFMLDGVPGDDNDIALRLMSIDLIDIDSNNQDATVILTDLDGLKRTYDVPSMWTRDVDSDGPAGYSTLDLTSLSPQAGELGNLALASEDDGFDEYAVGSMEILFSGSAALDNITYEIIPAPSAAILLLAPLFGRRRRRELI